MGVSFLIIHPTTNGITDNWYLGYRKDKNCNNHLTVLMKFGKSMAA